MNYYKLIPFSKKIIIFIVLLSIGMSVFGADERDQPIDLVIALDKSRSMEEEIDAVKEYIKNYIIADRLIVGDYFLCIAFYRKAEVVAAGYIYSDKDKEDMKRIVSGVEADGYWTDIGNMFDRLGEELIERLNNNRRKRFLIITDGINEPPKNSKYFTKDGDLTHEYLDYIDNLIVNPGWKVQILALGQDPGLDVFRNDIKGEYSQLGEDATAEDMDQAVGELIGEIELIKDNLKPLTLRGSGKGTLIIPVKTHLFNEDPVLILDKIHLSTPDFAGNILINKFTKPLPADSVKLATASGKEGDTGIIDISIPVDAGKGVIPGDFQGELSFTFESTARFSTPISVKVHVNTIWEDNPWLLVLLIFVAIVLLVILVVGIMKLIQGHPIKFKILVEEMPLPKGKDIFKISRGKKLYILESMDFIRISEKKNNRCFGRLGVMNEDLKLYVLKENHFAQPKDIPKNVLEATVEVITENGKHYHVTFSEIT